jgi:hypothetical protein
MFEPTEQDRKRLESQSMLNKPIKFKTKGSEEFSVIGIVEDEVYVIVNDYKHMIQKVRFSEGKGWGGNQFAYRTGYYTFQYGTNKIKWGQFTHFLTESEYKELLDKAKSKGWGIFKDHLVA